jgi:hypothetical protein
VIEAKNGCTSGGPTPAAVYTVGGGSPIKQLPACGRKVTPHSAGSTAAAAAASHDRLLHNDVNDDVWVGIGSLLPVVSAAQPDVLPASSPATPETVSTAAGAAGRVRNSVAVVDRKSAGQLPEAPRQRHEVDDHPTEMAAADDVDAAEDGPTWVSNRECLRRAEKSAPGEVRAASDVT